MPFVSAISLPSSFLSRCIFFSAPFNCFIVRAASVLLWFCHLCAVLLRLHFEHLNPLLHPRIFNV
jgi:hypothetical protein